jgi:hypothetical protein
MQEAAVWVLVRAAGSLHDAVQGQKCIHDDLGHSLVLHHNDEPTGSRILRLIRGTRAGRAGDLGGRETLSGVVIR